MNPFLAYRNSEQLFDTEDKGKLLIKVFEEMQKKLDSVEDAIGKRDYERKFKELSKIITGLEILDSSLDKKAWRYAENLSALYRYMIRRLTEVNSTLDVRTIRECKGLLASIMDGFKKAYEKERKEHRSLDLPFPEQKKGT